MDTTLVIVLSAVLFAVLMLGTCFAINRSFDGGGAKRWRRRSAAGGADGPGSGGTGVDGAAGRR